MMPIICLSFPDKQRIRFTVLCPRVESVTPSHTFNLPRVLTCDSRTGWMGPLRFKRSVIKSTALFLNLTRGCSGVEPKVLPSRLRS